MTSSAEEANRKALRLEVIASNLKMQEFILQPLWFLLALASFLNIELNPQKVFVNMFPWNTDEF